MNNFLALMILGLLQVFFVGPAQAGTTLTVEKSGDFCIHRSTYSMEEVTESILEQNLFRDCEASGGFPQLKSLQLDYQGRKCPYGHSFHYAVSGECTIP